PAGAYVLDDDTLGELDFDDTGGTVTIDGAGEDPVTIAAATTYGAATTRVLQVESGAVADISGVTISEGDASVSGEAGGGILNGGNLTLSDAIVTNSQTNDGPG